MRFCSAFAPDRSRRGGSGSATPSTSAPQTMDDDEDESFLYSGIDKESGGSNGAAQSTSPSLLPPSTR